jgi:hypothetical protein
MASASRSPLARIPSRSITESRETGIAWLLVHLAAIQFELLWLGSRDSNPNYLIQSPIQMVRRSL